ncbi:MAG: HAD family hydrolase [Spirochaeta sp.]
MLKAVIFDMDGVIIDSEPLHTQVVIEVLAEQGIAMTSEKLVKYIGTSNRPMWEELRAEFGIPVDVDDLVKRQHDANLEHLRTFSDLLIPGVLDLIQDLHHRRIPLAVASSSGRDYIEAVLLKYRLTEFFPVVVSGAEVPRGKPEPDIFLSAALQLGVPAVNCTVIEDSRHGVTAGRAAGMRVIGFQNPHSGNQDLSHAQHIADSMPAVAALL